MEENIDQYLIEMMYSSLAVVLLAAGAQAQFFNNFFGGGQQQHQQQQVPKKSYEELVLNDDCKDYLCPQTRECVKQALDCSCPFPKSQLKCVLPDQKNYLCISKPATLEEDLINLYDDPVKGPKAAIEGERDCGWVNKAYNGLL